MLTLILTIISNIIDTTSTLWALQHGFVELNPVMRHLIDTDWRLFVALKLVVVSSLFVFLYRQKTRYAWYAACIPYMGLATYQIGCFVWWTWIK